MLHTRKRKFSSVDSKIFSQAKIQTPHSARKNICHNAKATLQILCFILVRENFLSVDSKIFSQAEIQTPKLFYVNIFM